MKGKISKKKLYGILSAVALILVVAFLHGDKVAAEITVDDNEQICSGIFLDAIDVSGMTCQEAKDAYEAYLNDLRNITLEFSLESEKCSVSMADLELKADIDAAVEEAYAYGHRGNILKRYKEMMEISNENKEISVALSINEDYLIEILDEALADYIVPAKNASLEYVDGKMKVIDDEGGKELNSEETIDKLIEAIKGWTGGRELRIEVATNELEPEYTAKDLEAVEDLLGVFETRYSAGDVSRNNNIMNAANKISGSVLYPGEEFDTMAHLVPFTTDNGWSYAGAYLNGEVISDIGGGICQVSTTLYNAVLQAELEVSERYPHSMAVGYVQLSADAALNEGTKNFKFVNNTDTPIYIYAYASNGTLHVSIFGKEYRDSDRSIDYRNEILGTIPAGDPIETIDESQPADYRVVTQTAHTGYRANLWKYVYENGELVDTILVNTSYYSPSPERVTIGNPGSPAPEDPAADPNVPVDAPIPAEPSTEAPPLDAPVAPVPEG